MICKYHIKYLKEKMEPKNGYPYREIYEWNASYLISKEYNNGVFRWENRYGALKQTTTFFKNIVKIADLIYDSKSIEEFIINIDLHNIQKEAANFCICYIYMCPTRWFSFDWRFQDCDSHVILQSEYDAWHIEKSLFEKIDKMNLPMFEVDDFMKLDFS